ncbi:MAG: ATPase [Desulfurococcales archaeon ex4484_58]|nr:MAG: ATPase [Desulfurococcales archaeon ex4484_58]
MPPIIVNKPVEMKYVNIIIPRDDIERVINILHDIGAVHVEELGEKIEEYIERYEKITKLIDMINSLLNQVHGISIDVNLTRLELETITLELVEKDVTKLYNEVKGLSEKHKDIEEKLRDLKELYSILSVLPRNIPLKELYFEGRFLKTITLRGRIDAFKQLLSSLNEKINLLYRFESEQYITAVIVCLTSDYEEILEKISSLGLHVLDPNKIPRELHTIPTIDEALKWINEKIKEYTEILHDISSRINMKIREAVNDLCKYLVLLENRASEIKALLSVKNWKYLTLIGGWVPRKKVKELISVLHRNNISFYIEQKDPIRGKDEPPTLLENPPLIQWYEPIVKFIGLPRYWEWDPTPIIAYSFALFFGIMLGDMGYAVALIVAVLLFLDKFVTDPNSRDYKFFKYSLIVSSIVGFIIGFLSGSVFGIQLFTIVDVFIDPLKFLVVALIIGLIHVNISHALTLAKSIKERNFGGALSETGLFVAEAFGVPYIMYTMLDTPLPGIPIWLYNYFLYLAFVGVALIVIGMIRSIGGLGLLMWLFSLTGLLGDVLSYSRLAGVGLATIYLGASFNAIATLAFNGLKSTIPVEIVGFILGGIVAGLTLFFGHLLNTILSAIGGFIHSLRLCFVEFLSKFYEGTGYPFEPLRVVFRRRIVIE